MIDGMTHTEATRESTVATEHDGRLVYDAPRAGPPQVLVDRAAALFPYPLDEMQRAVTEWRWVPAELREYFPRAMTWDVDMLYEHFDALHLGGARDDQQRASRRVVRDCRRSGEDRKP